MPAKTPKHIAFNIKQLDYWAEINSVDIRQAIRESNKRIVEMAELCIKEKVIIFTFNVLGSDFKPENFSSYMDELVNLLDNLARSSLIHSSRVKISVIGKWYDLPSKVIDSIKNAINRTSEYDNFFLNLCLNYDGKEEIINALKVIMRSIQYEKISPDQLTKQLIKENIYTSYFIPPELIVLTHDSRTDGFLLWDSPDSSMYFSGVEWNDFDKKELKKALDAYKE